MYKYVFKEIEPESIDTSSYFDYDGFSENAGSYNYTLFIMYHYHNNVYGLNEKEYNNVKEEIYQLFNDFEYVENHKREYTYKQAMKENRIDYNPTKCSKLKHIYLNDYDGFINYSIVASYLTIKTGKTWKTLVVHGYCQGDIVTVIYCEDCYTKEQAETTGNIYLGCCKEFCFACLEKDENGQEIIQEFSEVYGYFVADCEYHNATELKKVLCNMEGVKPEETKLLLIDTSSYKTVTTYDYTEV